MDEILGVGDEVTEFEVLDAQTDLTSIADLVVIHRGLRSMGRIPVADEFGNANWVRPSEPSDSEVPTDT